MTLEHLITTFIIGSVTATGIIHYQEAGRACSPVTADAITWQDDTVRIYQENFPESAAAAVEQWASRKITGETRQAALLSFSNSGEISGLEKTAAEEIKEN